MKVAARSTIAQPSIFACHARPENKGKIRSIATTSTGYGKIGLMWARNFLKGNASLFGDAQRTPQSIAVPEVKY
jgi:hypothetical protein